MELDGLSANPSQLGEAAQAAMAYLQSHIRSHSTSLKVQTSKGNYLTSLNVRAEQVDFADGTSERNMDDLILKAAIWQDEHWVDRSAMLKSTAMASDGSVKVVLLSLDRNCECLRLFFRDDSSHSSLQCVSRLARDNSQPPARRTSHRSWFLGHEPRIRSDRVALLPSGSGCYPGNWSSSLPKRN
jgi:hypothetical protein